MIIRRLLLPSLLLTVLTGHVAQATDNTGLTVSQPPPIAEQARPVEQPVALPEPPEPSEPVDPAAEAAADNIPAPTAPADDDVRPAPNTIILQGLNKVTGHISRLEAPIGTVMRFGNLEIIGRRCWQSPQDEQPENAGLMEIWELKPGESHERIFLGWIFSSSPGLSGLEHPVYDVTMIECAYIGATHAPAHTSADDKAPKE
jgi:hypothetical protein